MIRRPPRSTLFPTRRSSDLHRVARLARILVLLAREQTDHVEDRHPPVDRDATEGVHRCVEAGVLDHEHARRSEEHTSELQSLAYLVCRLLLEKKKIHRDV